MVYYWNPEWHEIIFFIVLWRSIFKSMITCEKHNNNNNNKSGFFSFSCVKPSLKKKKQFFFMSLKKKKLLWDERWKMFFLVFWWSVSLQTKSVFLLIYGNTYINKFSKNKIKYKNLDFFFLSCVNQVKKQTSHEKWFFCLVFQSCESKWKRKHGFVFFF